MKYLLFLLIFISGERIASAQGMCWGTRNCSASNPCNLDLNDCPPEYPDCDDSFTVTCGQGCYFGAASGALGCEDHIRVSASDPSQWCGKPKPLGVGCCSTYCPPPFVNCEPN